MLTTIAWAFVLATALLFLFRQTRWIGVVCVFVLLVISPLIFTALLLLLGVGYLVYFRKASRNAYGGTPVVPDEAGRRSRSRFILVGLLGVGGALAIPTLRSVPGDVPMSAVSDVRSTPSEEVIVLRTPGGLLEVSRIHTIEILDARVTHKLLGIEVGELVPRIRVPVVYRYHVELAPEWRVVRTEDVFTVIVPKVKPSLPVAVDFSGIEKDVSGTWILVPWKGAADLASLEKGITQKLGQKAGSRDYIQRQRLAAQVTVREFVRQWLMEQSKWRDFEHQHIRVLFGDEHLQPDELAGR